MNSTEKRVHKFEVAGLGKAPFRFVGTYESKFQAVPGDPNCPIQPGTSCDYCGTGIMLVCRIRDAQGKEFKVGCDCVAKTGDAGLSRQVDSAVANRRRAMTHKRQDETIAAGKAALSEVVDVLRAQPHPAAYMAEKGLTLLDSVEWLFEHAGRVGKVKAAKIVLKAKGV